MTMPTIRLRRVPLLGPCAAGRVRVAGRWEWYAVTRWGFVWWTGRRLLKGR